MFLKCFDDEFFFFVHDVQAFIYFHMFLYITMAQDYRLRC